MGACAGDRTEIPYVSDGLNRLKLVIIDPDKQYRSYEVWIGFPVESSRTFRAVFTRHHLKM